MRKSPHLVTRILAAAALAAGAAGALADGDGPHSADTFCMDVELGPFHLIPDGSCAVRDYWDGGLQETYYPFTMEEHLFNCEFFGPVTTLPTGDMVPSSVISDEQEPITGTIGGYPFTGTLLCASLTNWYQDSCSDPDDPSTCAFQLAQPFLAQGLPYPRVTEVSVLDGVITVDKGNGKTADVPIVMATRAAGIMHLEDLEAPLVGGSITHSLLGLATYDMEDEEVSDEAMDDVADLGGSLDLLLQGHIFFPGSVEDDVDPETGKNEAAVIKGTICSKKLHKLLDRESKKGGKPGKDD